MDAGIGLEVHAIHGHRKTNTRSWRSIETPAHSKRGIKLLLLDVPVCIVRDFRVPPWTRFFSQLSTRGALLVRITTCGENYIQPSTPYVPWKSTPHATALLSF